MSGKGKSSKNASKGKAPAAKKATRAKTTNSVIQRKTNNSANAAISDSNILPPPNTKSDEFDTMETRVSNLEKQLQENLSEQRTFFAQITSLLSNTDKQSEQSTRKRTISDTEDTQTITKRKRINSPAESDSEDENENRNIADDNRVKVPRTIPSGENFRSVFSTLPSETQERVAAMAPSALASFSHVDLKLREKIWAQEFVDLTLLSPRQGLYEEEFTLALRSDGSSSTPIISMTPKNKSKINHIAQWETLFEVYTAVFISHPKLSVNAIPMMSYRKHVRDLARAHADWKAYDESFRAMRVHESWSWDYVPPALMNEVTLRAIINLRNDYFLPQNPPADKSNKDNKNRNKKSCNQFNKFGTCEYVNCRFPHICRSCGGDHSELKCLESSA